MFGSLNFLFCLLYTGSLLCWPNSLLQSWVQVWCSCRNLQKGEQCGSMVWEIRSQILGQGGCLSWREDVMSRWLHLLSSAWRAIWMLPYTQGTSWNLFKQRQFVFTGDPANELFWQANQSFDGLKEDVWFDSQMFFVAELQCFFAFTGSLLWRWPFMLPPRIHMWCGRSMQNGK